MRINNNMMAMNSHRQLGLNNEAVGKATERLSSGFRVNRAGDDAAGLSISEKMRGQIRGLNQASRNAQDAISLIQTAEGALNETHAILQRMRELAVQSANDTNVTIDRVALQNEMNQLAGEITRIANNTEFNTRTLMSGKFADGTPNPTIDPTKSSGSNPGNLDFANANATSAQNFLAFQIGANSGQAVGLRLNIMTASALGVARTSFTGASNENVVGLSISSHFHARQAITKINSGIQQVAAERSKLGALQNRLESTIRNLDNVSENLQTAESRIRDVDMAQEMMEFTKQNILSQAATSMLAQANMAPQNVLQLLG